MNPTKNQKLAVESIGQPTAIIAGAGSGKTEVLTRRLQHILTQGGANLNQILAITFTEKAAQEMKRRVAKNLDPEIKKELPWAAIGTFHGFCLNVLKEHGTLLGWSSFLSVWDEHTTKLSIHRHCRSVLLTALQNKNEEPLLLVEEIEFRNALALLEELMGSRWHWENLKSIVHSPWSIVPKEKKLLEATKQLYDQALKNYNEEKSLRQALDFQDLEILTLKLFQEKKNILKEYQNRFKHILVDEAQDINDLQQALIRLLFDPKKNALCIVGDPKQSIYRFRGANVEGFNKMVEMILKTGGAKIELNENFRSRPGVLEWINHAFGPLFDPTEFAPLLPAREATEESNLVLLSVSADSKISVETRRKKEARTIGAYIRQQVSEKKNAFGDFALLFQSLSTVHLYEEAFKEANIPYRLFGGRGFLSAQEVLDSLFILKIIADPSDRLALVGLMRSPFIGLTDVQITILALQHGGDLMEALLKLDEAAWLKKLFADKENRNTAEILEQAILATHYDVLLSRLDPSGAKEANIEQLITFVRELETTEGMSLEEILNYCDTLKDRGTPFAQAPADDTTAVGACQMMTVHQAKGLEFPVVILPDLLRSLPQSNRRTLFARGEGLGFYLRKEETPLGGWSPSETVTVLSEKEKYQDLKERKRLLYVAMTRAEEKLVLPLHENVAKGGLWHTWIQEALSHYKENVEKYGSCQLWDPFPRSLRSEGTNPKAVTRIFQPILHQKEPIYHTVTDLEKMMEEKTFFKQPFLPKKEGLDGAELGNLIHTALKEMTIDVKTHALNLSLRATEGELKEVSDLLSKFLNGPLAPSTWEGQHELPFRLKCGSAVITGMIDYVYETDKGFVICDFKTDQEFHPEKYKLQMDIYALALSKANAKPVLETRLLYLKLKKAHVEVCDAKRLRRTEEEISAQHYHINGGEDS